VIVTVFVASAVPSHRSRGAAIRAYNIFYGRGGAAYLTVALRTTVTFEPGAT